MRIDSPGHHVPSRPAHAGGGPNGQGAIHGKSGREEPTRAANHGQVPPEIGGVKPEQTEAHDGDHDRAKGVLRLLEEGHFKGVADVRLRINFFDELSAGATAATLEALPAQADDLVATLEEQVAALTTTFEVDEATSVAIADLMAGFDAEVQEVAEAAAADGSLDRDALAASIRAAFEATLTELQALFAPADEEPVEPIDPEGQDEAGQEEETEEGTVIDETTEGAAEAIGAEGDSGGAETEVTGEVAVAVAETTEATGEGTEVVPSETDGADGGAVDGTDGAVVVDEEAAVEDAPAEPEPEAPSLEDAFATLAETFEAALADFVASLDSSLRLPDPAPYSGNGGAYEKFLAIYNELRGVSPEPAEAPDHDELA